MTSASNFPTSIGVLLFPNFEVLDVAGPIEALNCLARTPDHGDLKVSLISKTLDPVSAGPIAPDTTATAFMAKQLYPPTHTFSAAPDLEVLLVPGGMGCVDPLPGGGKPDIDQHVEFIRDAFNGRNGRKPWKYLISVCNGTMPLIRAGVLDGQKATTNKDMWEQITAMGPKTHLIARARWVDSGRVWTTSGVSAGADGVLARMESLVPRETVTKVVNMMEWIRADNVDHDPFAEVFGCRDVPPVQG